MLGAFTDSKVDSSLRINAVETFLTARRYEQGQKEYQEPSLPEKRFITDFIKETNSTQAVENKLQLLKPKSFEQAINRIIEIYEKSSEGNNLPLWNFIEINLCFTTALKYIESNKSLDELNNLYETILRIKNFNLHKIFPDQTSLNVALNEAGLKSNALVAGAEFIKSSIFFNDEEVVKQYFNRQKNVSRIHKDTIFLRLFANSYNRVRVMPDVFLLYEPDGSTPIHSEYDLGQELHIHSVSYFMSENWQKFSKDQKKQFLKLLLFDRNQNYGSLDGFLPTVPRAYFNITDENYSRLLRNWNQSLLESFENMSKRLRDDEINRISDLARIGDEKSLAIFNDYKQMINLVWENRDFFALSNRQKIDWELIFKTLNINSEHGYVAIRESVESLLLNKNSDRINMFVELLRSGFSQYIDLNWIPKVDELWKNKMWISLRQVYLEKAKLSEFTLKQSEASVNEQKYISRYGFLLLTKLNTLPPYVRLDHEIVKSMHDDIYVRLFGTDGVNTSKSWGTSYSEIYFNILLKSKLTFHQKGQLLKLLFLTDSKFAISENYNQPKDIYSYNRPNVKGIFPESWSDSLLYRGKDQIEPLLNALIKYNVIPDVVFFIKQIRQMHITKLGTFSTLKNNQNRIYYDFINSCSLQLLRFMNSKSLTKQEWNDLVLILTPPNSKKYMVYNSGLREIKKLIIQKYETELSNEFLNFNFFIWLTDTGVNTDTDLFFKKFVLNKTTNENIKFILSNKLLKDKKMAIELTRNIISSKVKALSESSYQSSEDQFDLIKFINELNPDPSESKDKLLEELAWTMGLINKPLDPRLSVFIQANKSSNLFRPEKIEYPQWASVVIELVKEFSIYDRWNLIKVLHNPEKYESGLPHVKDAIFEAIVKFKDFERIKEACQLFNIDTSKETMGRAELADFLTSELEKFSHESGIYEKTFVINSIFKITHRSNNLSLQNESDFFDYIIIKLLENKKDSDRYKLIKTFILNTVDEHERAITLAHMLALSGKDGFQAAELFKIFQTLGIKFGQLSGIWNLFGDEISGQSKSLKDKALPLDKADILNILKNELPDLASELKLIRVIGSASIKTVILVEYKKQKLVMMVKNPNISQQVKTNLKLSKKLIKALSEANIFEGSAFFNLLVEGLEHQILEEIEFSHELTMAQKIKAPFQKLASEIKNDWKMELVMPSQLLPSSGNIAFYEYAEGIGYDQLTVREQRAVGDIITKFNLALFFRYGFFEPDRHKGNFIFKKTNDGNNTIYYIDIGQVKKFEISQNPFSWDDRLSVAQFLKAMSDKNAELLIEMGLLMSSENKPNIDKSQLVNKIEKIFLENKSQVESIESIIKTLTENGIRLNPKFTFVIIKGFMVLYGENYVADHEFKLYLEQEITNLFIKKSGIKSIRRLTTSAALQKIKSYWNQSNKKMDKIKCQELFL